VLHVYALDINFRLTLTFRSYVNAFIVFPVVVSVVYDIYRPILLYTTTRVIIGLFTYRLNI